MKYRKAFSLSITLWISAALMSGAIYFLQISKENIKITSQLNDKLDAKLEMISTLSLVHHYLIQGKFHYNYILIPSQKYFGNKLPIDSTPIKYKNSTISIQDAGGLINTLNQSDTIPYLIKTNTSHKQFIIFRDSLLDWLDTNSFKRLNGAEKYYYTSIGCNYSARSQNFIYFYDELYNIRGFENIDLNKTNIIHSSSTSFNPYVMSESVLQTIFRLKPNLAHKLILDRKKDLKLFTSNLYAYSASKDYSVFIDKTFKITITTTINHTTTSYSEVINLPKNIIEYIE
jgi:hypothetical protein